MSATTDFVNMVSRGFNRGYIQGKDWDQRQGLKDVGDFSVEDHVIPQEAASNQETTGRWTPEGGAVEAAVPSATTPLGSATPVDEEAGPAYAEGGDPEAVTKLLAADKESGAIPADPEYGSNPIDRSAKLQQKIPKARVIDWEAAKKAKAAAYARAGMSEKAANVDEEFDDLKHRKFQEYASRALAVLDSDPARAAEYLSMANQYSTDGTNTVYIPTPGGQLMEVPFDEMTRQPLGEGTPLDKASIEKYILMNADPSKFMYHQLDRSWQEQVHKDRVDQVNKQFDQAAQQHRDTLKARYKGMQVDVMLANLRNVTALEKARIDSGDDTWEAIGDFKADVIGLLANTEKGYMTLGLENLTKEQMQKGHAALAAGAGRWRGPNGADLGAAEALMAQDYIMSGPVKSFGQVLHQDPLTGVWEFTHPETSIKLVMPDSAVNIAEARKNAEDGK